MDLEAGAVDPEIANAMEAVETLRDKLHEVQDAFLRVEKFANLNTTAVYKILKKHDKLLPHTTCCRYYLERLHAHAPRRLGLLDQRQPHLLELLAREHRVFKLRLGLLELGGPLRARGGVRVLRLAELLRHRPPIRLDARAREKG